MCSDILRKHFGSVPFKDLVAWFQRFGSFTPSVLAHVAAQGLTGQKDIAYIIHMMCHTCPLAFAGFFVAIACA